MDAGFNPLDLGALRATGATPHWFGLGFVQLKLDETRRVHFWHPGHGQITPEEELHDHRYDFHSRILAGEMVHEVWDWTMNPGGDHEMLEVSCRPDSASEPIFLERGRVTLADRQVLRAGDVYSFSSERFHRGFAKGAITFLTRGQVTKDFARIIHPIGMPTVCPFSVHRTEEDCWAMIAEMLSGAGG